MLYMLLHYNIGSMLAGIHFRVIRVICYCSSILIFVFPLRSFINAFVISFALLLTAVLMCNFFVQKPLIHAQSKMLQEMNLSGKIGNLLTETILQRFITFGQSWESLCSRMWTSFLCRDFLGKQMW